MKTLKLNNFMRNLTLLAAGAFMATLVVMPLTTSARDDDDGFRPAAAPAATYMLVNSDATVSVFALVENDGSMVLSLVEEPSVFVDNDDE